jgi:RNA polymerase sigma factor (sigma-70 family)
MGNTQQYKIKKTVSRAPEKFLKSYLADTPEEAESVYNQFSGLLNTIAFSYSKVTGLDKSDLFAESLLGLARAKRDFNEERSDNFKTFAIYKIKDALSEYIRKNISPVVIPSYVRKANSLINNLKLSLGEQRFFEALEQQDIILLKDLYETAERCNLTVDELVIRASITPSGVEFDDYEGEAETTFSDLLIKQVKEKMSPRERVVAEGILQDKTYEEIATEIGKTKARVTQIVKGFERFR